MARKLDGLLPPGESSIDNGPASPPAPPRRRSLLGRREFLQRGAVGTAAAASLLGASAGSVAGSSDYETITLEAGEQRQHRLSAGEVFENVLIDQTADGSMFSIAVEDGADNWFIRNVGWKGVAPRGSGAREYTFLVHARGDGLIENVFIDQRDHDGGGEGSDVGGIWTYSDSHHGHIECRHNFIAGCGNNASYTSGDGWSHNGATGTVSHFRSYHRDNTISNFRPGNPGSEIRECVSVANDPAGSRGSYPGSDSQLCRAVWAWHNPDIVVRDSAFWHDPGDAQPTAPFWATWRSGGRTSGGDAAELTVINCDINNSWEDAGNDLAPSSHGGDHTDVRRVVIEGLGYSPSVSILGDGVPLTAEMAARGERGLPPELGTAPSGGHGETDRVDPWSYEAADGVHTDLPYELVIDHVSPGARVTYEIEFDGPVEAGEWEHNATVNGRLATGGLGPDRGLDNLYFDGSIQRFDVENEAHAAFFLADAQSREILTQLTPEEALGTFDKSGDDTDEEAPEDQPNSTDDDINEDEANHTCTSMDPNNSSAETVCDRLEDEDGEIIAIANDTTQPVGSGDDHTTQPTENDPELEAQGQPGFGVLGALASIGVGGLLLRYRRNRDR